MPELARKIKMYFALAPVATIKYARSPAVKLLNIPERFLRVRPKACCKAILLTFEQSQTVYEFTWE